MVNQLPKVTENGICLQDPFLSSSLFPTFKKYLFIWPHLVLLVALWFFFLSYFFNFGINHLRSSYIFYETFYLPFNELYTTNQKIKRKMQNDLAGAMEKEGWPTKSRRATRGRVDLGMVEEGGGHSEGGSERPEAGQGS